MSRPAIRAGGGLWAAALLFGCAPAEPATAPLALTDLLRSGAGDEAFARADGPREFRFPRDHAAHPEFETEWWYVTGNLRDGRGRAYGFHWTVFRRGLHGARERSSAAAARDLYLGHFAVADAEGGRVLEEERFARGALGLAGAELAAGPEGELRVWVEDWELRGVEGLGDRQLPAFELRAREGGVALDLRLEARKPLVLQGDGGLSRKGEGEGQASYYYSLPRLAVRGELTLDGEARTVSGEAWLDREWSTAVLGERQLGWDWFALQLSDGSELMVYTMRLAGGGIDRTSHGAAIAADGSARKLGVEEFELEATGTWRSPRSGAEYPSGWTLRVPSEGLQLEVEPLLEDQELPLSIVYWEGAVEVRGNRDGEPISGVGFAELTGYAGP
jgi:predicted secreted hydrolase